jgi:hypothetical protein
LSKHCEFCGKFFIPDTRVGNRQRACFRKECKKTRKQSAQRAWVAREGPGYFAGRYPYVKEWREKRRQASLEMIQDEIPPAKPCLKLVLILPVIRDEMIQDEITLRRIDRSTFAAHGVSRRMIQDTMAHSP